MPKSVSNSMPHALTRACLQHARGSPQEHAQVGLQQRAPCPHKSMSAAKLVSLLACWTWRAQQHALDPQDASKSAFCHDS
eukprot:360262-Chlamydomonas_euryale.AAC.17